jgi:CheY-like chemotaxis protein
MTPFSLNYNPRTLILDDNEGNRTLIRLALQMATIPSDEVSTGEEALRLWAAQPGNYAFAVLDIELPDISGLAVARRIRQQDQGIVIIICSANDDPALIEEAVYLDCDIFIVKPFQFNTLASMAKLLDRATLRIASQMMIIDNTGQMRWEIRTPRNFVWRLPMSTVQRPPMNLK